MVKKRKYAITSHAVTCARAHTNSNDRRRRQRRGGERGAGRHVTLRFVSIVYSVVSRMGNINCARVANYNTKLCIVIVPNPRIFALFPYRIFQVFVAKRSFISSGYSSVFCV